SFGRKVFPPFFDELFISLANRPDVAIEIIEAERVDVAILLSKGRIPINLIGQRIPCETNDRYSINARLQNVCPLLPQPENGFVAAGALPKVCFGMHNGQAISLEV